MNLKKFLISLSVLLVLVSLVFLGGYKYYKDRFSNDTVPVENSSFSQLVIDKGFDYTGFERIVRIEELLSNDSNSTRLRVEFITDPGNIQIVSLNCGSQDFNFHGKDKSEFVDMFFKAQCEDTSCTSLGGNCTKDLQKSL